MEFRLLGGVEAIVGDQTVRLGRRRERLLLGLLLLDAGRPVPVERLIDLMWEEPPGSARATVHTHVARLRATLTAFGAVIARTDDGYLAEVAPATVDAHAFRVGVDAGLRSAEPGERARRLDDALGLWRGAPLLGVAPDRLADRIGGPWVTLHRAAVEARAVARLAGGDVEVAAAELAALVPAHPTAERLTELSMVALYRSGRQVEALDAYRNLRTALRDEIGVDPGPAVTALHRRILRRDPALDAEVLPATSAGPERPHRTFPARLPDFVGRVRELAAIDAALRAGPAVVAITGMGGLGKSTLAVLAAHRAADAFPGGRLYADLRGTGARPASPHAVTGDLLRAAGLDPERIPDDPAERLALYRAYTGKHRVLIVLDDARDEAQVSALLPAGGAALVTARGALAGLDATSIRLAAMPESDGGRMLCRMAGLDGDEATAVARLCGGLPLALRVVGARLAAGADPARLRESLADEWRRLDQLAVGDRDVRGTLALSHRRLSPAAGALFALLGALPVADVPAWVPGALLAGAPDGALAELVDAALLAVSRTGEEPRYRLHDLIHLYAREQPHPDRDAARRRVYETLAGLVVDHDAALVRDGFPTPPRDRRWFRAPAAATSSDPAAWFAAERDLVTAAVEDAVDRGWARLAAQLLGAATNLADLRDGPEEGDRLTELVLAVVGGRRGLEFEEATLLLAYGGRRRARGELDRALPLLRRARRLFHGLDDPGRAATAATEMAIVYRRRHRPEAAVRFFEWAIARFAVAGHPPQETAAHVGLGNLHLTAGRTDLARESYVRALAFVRRHRDTSSHLPNVLGCLAEVRSLDGDHRAALDGYHEAMARAAEMDDRKQWAQLQFQVARVHERIGDPVPLALAADRAAAALDGVGLVRLADRARAMAAGARAVIDSAPAAIG